MGDRGFKGLSAFAVAFIALFAAWIGFSWGGARATQIFDDLSQLAPALVAAALCAVAAKREHQRARRAWALMAVATASWALGEAIWSWYEIVLHRDVPFPSFADAGYLGLVPLAAAAMLSFPVTRRNAAQRVRTLLDGCIIAAGLLMVSWATVLGPVYRASSGSTLSRVVGLAYPVGDFVIISIVAFVVARSRRGRTPMVLLGAGLVCLSVADSGFAYLTTKSSYSTGNWIDIGWVAGFLIIAVAAVRRRPGETLVETEPRPGEVGVVWPHIPVALALGIEVWKKITLGRVEPFLFWSFMFVVVAALLRQVLILRERNSLEEELVRQAMHDPLTQLANRNLFRSRVEAAVHRMRRTGEPFAVTFLDLDDFKIVNDSLGHEAGDRLLREVAARIRVSSRGIDTVARLGGDEFGILISGVSDPVTATMVAERVVTAIREPLTVHDREVSVGASVGIALCIGHESETDDLLANADVAMYRAKGTGKGRVEIFEPSMQEVVNRRATLQMELRRAIQHEQFTLVYQPIATVSGASIIGAEALIRWDHPVRGRLLPAEFLDAAEETGALVPLGRRTLAHAIEEAVRWSHPSSPWVSVNMSPRELSRPDIVGEIDAALAVSSLAPSRLVIEISEATLLYDADETVARLGRLADLGVRLAIDDFGVGYSSLRYLRSLPVDFVKIDRSFVEAMSRSAEDAALVRGIVRLASTLGIRTIAEGVETTEQQRELEKMGCDLIQGYLIAEPMESSQLAQVLGSTLPLRRRSRRPKSA